MFGWISDGRVVENARIVRDCWLDLPNHYSHVSLDTFVVMPDHIHGIIVLLDTHRIGDVRKDDVRAGLKGRVALRGRAGFKPALQIGMRLWILEYDTGCLRSYGH